MKVYVEADEMYPVYYVNEERIWSGEYEIDVSEEQFLAWRDAYQLFIASQVAIKEALQRGR